MSLRKTTSNDLIINLIGYDPENIKRAEQRWTERKNNTFITWNMFMLF